MRKKRKERDNQLHNIVDKYMRRFDKLMTAASKEIGKHKHDCGHDVSVHILSHFMIDHLASNMTNYYGTIEKAKDIFQETLDNIANARVINAKAERENITLN
tara:strand:+ start:34 stop:339 length:306 start_codon:yes stop_codon:yes gene_type:complete